MKRIIVNYGILTIGMFFVLSGAMAQKIQFGTYVERTCASPKAGAYFGIINKESLAFGIFYQETDIVYDYVLTEDQKNELPQKYEQEFAGVYIGAPLFQVKKIVVDLNIRTGLANGEYFVMTPTLLAKYKLVGNVSINGGVGIRAYRPTYQYGLAYTF